MKVFATLVLVLAGLVPAYADTTQTQTWDITATACFICTGNYGLPPQPISLSATFTTVTASGEFFDYGIDDLLYGTVDEVTSISGTLNGQPITLGAIPFGDGSWLTSYGPSYGAGGGFIGTVYFDVNGVPGWIYTDSDYDEISGIPVYWTATDPTGMPEPSALLLLTVPLSLGLMRWAQMSLRKYSARLIITELRGKSHRA